MPSRKQNPKGKQPPQDVSERTLDDWRRIYRAKAATLAAPAASSAAPAAPSSSIPSGSKAAPEVHGKRSALRSDMPVVKNARRGGADQAFAAARVEGMDSLVDDLYRDREAASGVGSTKSHIATWTKFHDKVYGTISGLGATPIMPLVPNQVIAVAALFKAGDYRSYANYLASMKAKHLDEGYAWSENLTHVGRWTTRSVLRGIGPSRQSHAIPLALVMRLPVRYLPAVTLGPTHPREAFLLGSIFLMREVELSATCVKHVTVNHSDETVTWLLTASKTDPQAHGVTRTWGCLCGEATLPCPYHTMELVLRSVGQYADAHRLCMDDRQNLPLFHDGTGCPPTKARVVATFEALALQCNLPLFTAEGLRL